MRIIIDENDKAQAQFADIMMPLSKVIRTIRLDQRVSCMAIESAANIDHPRYYSVDKGESDSLKVMIIALDVLGYDVIIKERDSNA